MSFDAAPAPLIEEPDRPVSPGRLRQLYFLECFCCLAATFMMAGIFFYTQQRLGWGARRNLLLCTAQGAAYVLGAVAANHISLAIGRRSLLRLLEIGLALLTALIIFFSSSSLLIAILVLCYTALAAAQWPLLESLVSSGANSRDLFRRISIYNLIWSGAGVLAMFASGPLLARCPAWFFVPALGCHLVNAAVLLKDEDDPSSSHGHAAPEAELVPLRTLAMRLSRIVLPATYAVSYAATALMPTLPVVQSFRPAPRLVVGSVWMIARFASFLLLSASGWWHTRPRALLVATITLLASFLGITLWNSAAGMIASQVAFGLATGMIYSGSLYFGMVLSDGSTESSGYHEALIGLGSVLGPGAGALANFYHPGNPASSVWAVTIVLCLSAIAAGAVSINTRRMRS